MVLFMVSDFNGYLCIKALRDKGIGYKGISSEARRFKEIVSD